MHFKSIIDSIGNTPLVTFPISKATILAKLEYLNPGGSVKDRSARYMIEQAEKNGFLKPGGTIIDASSGNQGIAVSMIGAMKGYNVIITVSEKISDEKRKTMEAYGAKVVVCPSTPLIDDPDNYHTRAIQLQKETPNSFMPNQYFNIDNRKAHYSSLGPEVWEQTKGTITHFFAGAGTGGTISGVGEYLKEKNPDVKIIAVDSNNSFRATKGHPKPYKVEGMGVDFDSPVLNYDILDEIIEVSDDNAIDMVRKMTRQYGLLAGPSSGAVGYAVQSYEANLKPTDVVVFICGDSGRAYLSKDFY